MNRKKDDTEVTNRKSSSEQVHKPRPEHALGALHGAYAHDVSPAARMANGFQEHTNASVGIAPIRERS